MDNPDRLQLPISVSVPLVPKSSHEFVLAQLEAINSAQLSAILRAIAQRLHSVRQEIYQHSQ